MTAKCVFNFQYKTLTSVEIHNLEILKVVGMDNGAVEWLSWA